MSATSQTRGPIWPGPRCVKRGAESAGTVDRRHELDVAVEVGRREDRMPLDRVRLRKVEPEQVVELPDGVLDLVFADDELDAIETEDLH